MKLYSTNACLILLIHLQIGFAQENKLPTKKLTAEEIEQRKQLKKVALGSVWFVGDLYNAHEEQFCGETIFRGAPPTSSIRIVDAYSSAIKFCHSDSNAEKFKILGVDGSLAASVSTGPFDLNFKGSGKFLNEHRDTTKDQVVSLVYEIRTKDELLNIFDRGLLGDHAVNDEVIDKSNATHVVTGITWGARTTMTFKFNQSDNFNHSNIEAQLKLGVEWGKDNTTGKRDKGFEVGGGFALKKGGTSNETEYRLAFHGDVVPPDGSLPTTIESALDVIEQIPKLIKKLNDGRGKPLEYRLMPIAILKELRKRIVETNALLHSIQGARLTQIVQLMDKLQFSKLQLNDFYNLVLENSDYVLKNYSVEIFDFIKDVDRKETKLKGELSATLKKLRSGKGNQIEIDYLIKDFLESKESPKQISKKLESWEHIEKKIRFAHEFIHAGAFFVRTRDFAYEHARSGNISYVLYFKDHETVEMQINRQDWGRNKQLLYSELRSDKVSEKNNNKYIVVDCSIVSPDPCAEMTSSMASFVRVYNRGNTTSKNLLMERRALEDDCGLILGNLNLWDLTAKGIEGILTAYTGVNSTGPGVKV